MNLHHECLRNLVSATLEKAGCTAPDAQSIARHLVESNLTGHDSHGVIRLPKYLEFLRDGVFKSGLDLEIVFENDIMAIVDGQFVFGQVVAERVLGPLEIEDMQIGRSLPEQRAEGEVVYHDQERRTRNAVARRLVGHFRIPDYVAGLGIETVHSVIRG